MDRKKTRVVHIVEGLEIGGLERVIQAIVLNLDAGRYEVAVWCLDRGGAVAEEIREKGVPVEILGMRTYHNPLNVLRLAHRLRRCGCRVAHTHGYFAGTFGRAAALLAGVPVILRHMHTTEYGFKTRNRWVERFLARFSDRVICVSEAVRDFAVGTLKIPEPLTCVIYNASPLESASAPAAATDSYRAQLGLNGRDRVVTVIASLTGNKGHGVLLDAFRGVSARCPEAKLVIVGDGPRKEALKTFAAAGLGSKVCFTGLVDDVGPVLGLSHVLVLPSLEREGLSVALIEGLGAGLPVVASRLGGIPEVVEDGVNGILVPPGDARALESAMARLLGSEALRTAMGNAGRDLFERRFSRAEMIGRVQSLYGAALGRRADGI